MEIQYLNTDLDIESKSDLSRIVEEFGEDVITLHHGERRGYQHASFEISTAYDNTDADGVINSFCRLVEQMPKEVREIWDGCVSRVFDIGYESGSAPQNFRSEIKASTIKRVAEIGASVAVTIYPPSGDFAPQEKPIQKRTHRTCSFNERREDTVSQHNYILNS